MIMQNTVTIQDRVYSVEQVEGKIATLKRYDKKSKFWVELSFSNSVTDGHTELLQKLGEVYIHQVLSKVEI